MGCEGLDYARWKADILEWALAEEMHMKINRQDDKAPNSIADWKEICAVFTDPDSTLTFSDSDEEDPGVIVGECRDIKYGNTKMSFQ
ncbi:hypothetical protein NDU88_007068 [Pleurodeles waltl]|uniref:Uncharacterized protein n=1 Tax=Pleurodeles waltl TaxID=8319 RepID=A0AAV7SRN1_PLEWA|nr:hypothetical protein NDU88_007068 [Pleurodeles waltl]